MKRKKILLSLYKKNFLLFWQFHTDINSDSWSKICLKELSIQYYDKPQKWGTKESRVIGIKGSANTA